MANRSHITQEMANYFDWSDVRAREIPYTMESQLLNLAAFELEDLGVRTVREENQSLTTVPTNIDNEGVYFGAALPPGLITTTGQQTLTSVVGHVGMTSTTLTPYVDTLPVPSRVQVDTTIDPIPFTNPILFTFNGIGTALPPSTATQYFNTVTELPIPNQLTFWITDTNINQFGISILITGETAPRPVWVKQRHIDTEVLSITSQGATKSINRWAVINSISVKGLPVGGRVACYTMSFAIPGVSDTARPYTHPAYRKVLFDRYWTIVPEFLQEVYMSEFSGLEYVQSYHITDPLIDTAVEPNTSGLFAVSANTLYYIDRREPMPVNLASMALTTEPLYGLQACYDITKPGPTRYVQLTAVAYANFANMFQYRYLMTDPTDTQYCILPNGAITPYSASAGWRQTPPTTLSFPCVMDGEYLFQLQCQDLTGKLTYDSAPYLNLALSASASFNISGTIDVVKGIAYDSYGQLWVWNGLFAIPLRVHYDGYVLDSVNQIIYTTEQYDSLVIS